MAGLYCAQTGMSTPDVLNPAYSMYGPQLTSHARQSVPTSSQLEEMAFWYRRDTRDMLQQESMSLYGREPVLAGVENTPKHRRTRSGCFTCRSRRIKCDETRPVCDRCNKGGRECEFPPPSTSKRMKHAEHRASKEHSSPKAKHKKAASGSILAVIEDESEEEEDAIGEPLGLVRNSHPPRSLSAESLKKKPKRRQRSETSPRSKEKGYSPSTDTSSSMSRSQTPPSSFNTMPSTSTVAAFEEPLGTSSSRWSHFRPDLQKYLQYQHDEMTYYHYFFKIDATDWVHTDLIDLALSFEPLLYAIVAFAAYHHTIRHEPNGSVSLFLQYYSKSLLLMRKHLEKHSQSFTEAMILTVLQLATFEEYLGDWVNLVGHHRAAHHMLLRLYQPTGDSLMATETSRMAFNWYARFDVIAGLMAGNETILDRAWYQVGQDWYESQIDPEEIDVENTYQFIVAANRLMGMDMAVCFSKLPRGQITIEQFEREIQGLEERLRRMKCQIQTLNDGYYTVTDFPYAQPLTDTDIVDPYIPGGLFCGVLWPLNFIWIDWYAIEQMQRYQTSIILQQPLPRRELEAFSLEQCRIYEAILRYPDAPPGCILGLHASLGLATVFLRKDQKHIDWARRRICEVERSGYSFPSKFRTKMAEMWGVESVAGPNGWWLDDNEGAIPILWEVRKISEERGPAGTGSTGPDGAKIGGGETSGEQKTEHHRAIRDMRAIFSKLNIEGPNDRQGSVGSGLGSPASGEDHSPRSESTVGSIGRANPAGPSPTAIQHSPGYLGSDKHQQQQQEQQQQQQQPPTYLPSPDLAKATQTGVRSRSNTTT